MAGNANLIIAKTEKNDEFYTRLVDVEKELQHYTKHFKGKIVYLPCDATWSAFWYYFHVNFSKLGLKKLIATYYDNTNTSYKTEYTGGNDEDINVFVKTALLCNGDFRSDECTKLLNTADIVVTNPPFSLFRDFIAWLVKADKKFLVIGNMNAITYKEFFPLLKDNKVWLGISIHSGDRKFVVPDDYPLEAAGCGIDEHGKRYIRVKGVRWFTNLDHNKRHEDLLLYKHYNPAEYPKYDNYDAIEVSKVSDIPMDYDGVMGVPITFLDKYNPEQFEIMGLDRYTVPKEFLVGGRVAVNGEPRYARILIRKKQQS